MKFSNRTPNTPYIYELAVKAKFEAYVHSSNKIGSFMLEVRPTISVLSSPMY